MKRLVCFSVDIGLGWVMAKFPCCDRAAQLTSAEQIDSYPKNEELIPATQSSE